MMNLWTLFRSNITRILSRAGKHLALVPFAMAFTGTHVQAEDEETRWFEVEVILFSNNVTLESTGESWKDQITPVNLSNSTDLLSSILFPEVETTIQVQAECLDTTETGFQKPPSQPSTLDESKEDPATEPQNESGARLVPEAEQPALAEQQNIDVDCSPYLAQENQVAQQQTTPADYERLPTLITNEAIPEKDLDAYLLSEDLLQLSESVKKLSSRGEYHPLLHTGWRQPVLGRRAATPMRLYAGNNFTGQFQYDGRIVAEPPPVESSVVEQLLETETKTDPAKETQTPTESDFNAFSAESAKEVSSDEALSPINPDGTPNQVWQLDGSLRIYLERYLYIEANMNLRRQGEREMKLEQLTQDAIKNQESGAELGNGDISDMTDDSVGVAEVIPLQEFSGEGSLVAENRKESYLFAYHMDQFRRVRSNELHYFDHPLIGMLIQIRPYEIRPEPEVVEEPPASEAVESSTEAEPLIEEATNSKSG